MDKSSIAFETERLRVVEATVALDDTHLVYLAFRKDPKVPQTIAHAVVSDMRESTEPVLCSLYCEFLEVSSIFRSQGYGKELFRGIEGHLKQEMHGVAVTEEGIRFLQALGRPADALEPHLAELQQLIDGLSQAVGDQEWLFKLTDQNDIARDCNRPFRGRSEAIKKMKEIIASHLTQS